MCLPQLVDHIMSLKNDPIKRHRAAQAATALSKIHHLKKKGIVPHSLALRQLIEMERRACSNGKSVKVSSRSAEASPQVNSTVRNESELRTSEESDSEVRLMFP